MANKKNKNKNSIDLLPNIFRTEKNNRFLSSTIDQLIKTPEIERIDGYVGSKFSKNYRPSDVYLKENLPFRKKYSLEPSLVIRDTNNKIKKMIGYDDLVNQINYYGGDISNLDKIFRPNVNSYDPKIDWDKFINHKDYFWVTMGPDAVDVSGPIANAITNFKVTDDGSYYIFDPQGLEENPQLTLYRGLTYIFDVDSKFSFYFKNKNVPGVSARYSQNVVGDGTKKGRVLLTVDNNTPSVLFYGADTLDVPNGKILIQNINENSILDIEKDILGKLNYISGNNIEFINGLKVKFVGRIFPEYYIGKEFIVEGVGQGIKLVNFEELLNPEGIANLYDVNFDSESFDEYPFDNYKNLPVTPEYITINRSSIDLNPWSRYNRWFHKEVLEKTAKYNNVEFIIPNENRALRPIIEFKPNLQLYNFTSKYIGTVNVIDEITTDVFSTAENSPGFYVDNVLLEEGFKVIFINDNDPLVKDKIFSVSYSIIDGKRKLNLTEYSSPPPGAGVLILNGDKRRGTEWYFNGSTWKLGQQRIKINQFPLFDLFDEYGNSYSEITDLFAGNHLFGYAIGTGASDSILGFPLKYRTTNETLVGTYLFQNYFNSEKILIKNLEETLRIPSTKSFLRLNKDLDNFSYENIWVPTVDYSIPVIQFEEINSKISDIEIKVFDNPLELPDFKIEVFVNDIKQRNNIDYVLKSRNNKLYVRFLSKLDGSKDIKFVLFKCYSATPANEYGIYDTPLTLTNNPLNGPILNFTLTEISDHVKTMIDRHPLFEGSLYGTNNIKNLPDLTQYGTRLISNDNPIVFANLFIGDIKNNLINSIRDAGIDYYQYKLNITNYFNSVNLENGIPEALDWILKEINQNKNSSFPYAQSDMLGYLGQIIERTFTVTDSRNKIYPLASAFNLYSLSNRSVLVYLNGNILLYGKDYIFLENDAGVEILKGLNKNDTLTIKDYVSTIACYIPPTPTKLGLYPKFEPLIYIDYSYADAPIKVIQGHDGSLTRAYSDYNEDDDFRDLLLLEFEKRIYNNLKVDYNRELLEINSVFPGIFRNSEFSFDQINKPIFDDFLKWTSTYGLDFSSNSFYNVDNYKTYNFSSTTDFNFNNQLPGSWRATYRYYFDTDRPNTHPWEILGFSEKPDWWEDEYGPAPYTNNNLNLWQDLEKGLIRQGTRQGIDPLYVRKGLSKCIPVDENGDLLDIRYWSGITEDQYIPDPDKNWSFGEMGPVETAWRRSSLWPFAVQVVLAICKPTDYCAKLFDTSRMKKDLTGKYAYGSDNIFITPASIKLFSDVDDAGQTILSSGYSVWVVEHGKQKIPNFVNNLKEELANLDFNLTHKAGGFLSKDKLEILIDAISPTTANPGVTLPKEDYTLHYNVSNPVKSIGISGIIIEKNNGQFIIKGYDRHYPYFIINRPIHKASNSVITVGGKTETFFEWKENSFYQNGQIVEYLNSYYRVIKSHNSGTTFDETLYAKIIKLPVVGGASVLQSDQFFEKEEIIPYNTKFNTLQEVYDFIIGYGHWLTNQGFIFDNYNQDLLEVIDWKFSGKEFLYWTTQNWANGSIITLSPFSYYVKYQFTDSIVNNIFDDFYDYSFLKANGQPFPNKNLSVSRTDGVCTITIKNTPDGIYFARLNLVQKEHALILNNYSIFNDIIYEVDAGFRQPRIRLIGLRTSGWNGDITSPGFVYDNADINNWQPYTDYKIADIVKYSGKYYSAIKSIPGSLSFEPSKWILLESKPNPELFPNFDYKINQFEDFYSLDVDNFDATQQSLAQHLTGYTPRIYLDNIFINPIAQYKFYQGFIKEKGTKNAVLKLAKASMINLQGEVDFYENWAFRTGSYGNYTSFNELRFPLKEKEFFENSQIIKFVDASPKLPNDIISYITPTELITKSINYTTETVFVTTSSTFSDPGFLLTTAGYVRTDDVTATAYNKNSLLDIANNGDIKEGDTIWLGFKEDGGWDVYRYTKQKVNILNSSVTVPNATLTFYTDKFHDLSVGDVISVYGLDNGTNGVYIVQDIPSLTSFSVKTTLVSSIDSKTEALMYKFISVRVSNFDNIIDLQKFVDFRYNDIIWTDYDNTGKWTVFKKIDNFTSTNFVSNLISSNQKYGSRVATRQGTDTVVISAPEFQNGDGYGRIFVYTIQPQDNTLEPIVNYSFNYFLPNNTFEKTNFGASLVYDKDYNIVVAGAPIAEVSGISTKGFIKVSKIDIENLSETTLAVEYIDHTERYGESLYLSRIKNTSIGDKLLMVGAPGSKRVFLYKFTSGNTPLIFFKELNNFLSNSQFGYSITGNSDATLVAISDIGYNKNTGQVFVYKIDENANIEQPKIINAPNICKPGDEFGHKIIMSDDGTYLFITTYKINDGKNFKGKVFVYKFNLDTEEYYLNQVIDNPAKTDKLFFGYTLSINDNADTLVVSATGDNFTNQLSFDDGNTIFDGDTCLFADIIKDTGDIFVFNRYNDKFVYADNLFDNSVKENSKFGSDVLINEHKIFVGAPSNINDVLSGSVFLFSEIDKELKSWSIHRIQDDIVDINKIKKIFTIDNPSNQIVDYLDIIDPLKGKISGLADQEIRYKTAFDPAVYSIGVNSVVVDIETSWVDNHIGELWWDLSTLKYIWYEQGDLKYRKNTWGKLFPGTSIDVYEWVKSEYLPSQWAALADTNDGLSLGISGQPKYPDNSVLSVKQYYNVTNGSVSNVYYYWVKNKVTIPRADFRKISSSEVARLIYDPAAYGLKYISVLDNNAISVTNLLDTLYEDKIHLNINKDIIDNNINQHTEWLLLAEGDSASTPSLLLEKKLIDSLIGRDSLGNSVPDVTLSESVRYGIEVRPRQSMFKDRFGALRNVFEYVNLICSQNVICDIADLRNLNSQEYVPEVEDRIYDIIVENNEELDAISTKDFVQCILTCTVENGKIYSVTIEDSGYGYIIPPTVTIVGDNSGAEIKTSIDSLGRVYAVEIVNSGNLFDMVPKLETRPFSVIVLLDNTSNYKWANYWWTGKQWVKIHTQNYNTTQLWDYVDWKSENFDELKPIISTVDETYSLVTLDLNLGDYVKVLNQGNGRYIILEKVNSNGTFSENYNLMYSEKGTIQFKDIIWDLNNFINSFDENSFDQTWFDRDFSTEISKILFALKRDIFIGQLKVHWNKLFFKTVRYAMHEQKFLDWAFKTSFINVTNFAGELTQKNSFKLQTSQYYENYINEVKPYHTLVRNFETNYLVTDPSNTFVTDFDLTSKYDPITEQFLPIDLDNINSNLFTATIIDTVDIGSDKIYLNDIETLDVGYPPWREIKNIIGIPAGTTVTNVDYDLSRNGLPYIEISNFTTATVSSGTIITITYPSVFVDSDKAWVENYGFELDSIIIAEQGNGYYEVPKVEIIPAYGDTGYGATARAYISIGKVIEIELLTPGQGYKSTPSVVISGGSSTESVTARAYAKLKNDKVRSNSIGIKFDRISPNKEILSRRVNDRFYCDGSLREFTLSWAAENIKLDIDIKINGIRVLAADYEIKNYKKIYNGYSKLYSDLVLSSFPNNGDVIEISYNKNISLYNAIERIEEYYNPTSGMPGKEPSQLMEGIDFPGVQYDTIPFSYSANWDVLNFNETYWGIQEPMNFIIDNGGTYYLQDWVNTQTYNIEIVAAPGDAVDEDATAVAYVTSGTITSIKFTNYGSGYALPPIVNILESTTGTTASIRIVLSSDDPLDINYDTILDGGDLAYKSATGINPEDIIVSGENFLSAEHSPAPEELIPGEVLESLGINVYTLNGSVSPVIIQKIFAIDSTGTSTVVSLDTIPANTASVMISYNNKVLNSDEDYNVDFYNNNVTITPRSETGNGNLLLVGVGGINPESYNFTKVSNKKTISLTLSVLLSNIKNIYVTLDGNTLTENDYTLSTVSSKNNLAKITVSNVDQNTNHTLQAWTFDSIVKGFNEVKEQYIVITDSNEKQYNLIQFPGLSGPLQSSAIVELNKKILLPPNTTYYVASASQNYYDVDPNNVYPSGFFDLTNLEVFVNGYKLTNGPDYILDQSNNRVQFLNDYLKDGDKISITNTMNCQYKLLDNKLILNDNLPITIGDKIKVITFTNHDSMQFVTNTYPAKSSRIYALNRTVINHSYVWVSINGNSLVNGTDYRIDDIGRNVIVSENYPFSYSDKVSIISLNDNSNQVIGYRIFKDMLNRTHYKRLSENNSSYLTSPLYSTSTVIEVHDSSALQTPNVKSNFPGVVLIDGERIEYMEKTGNKLSRLRRGTLGTGVKDMYKVGALVIDQGVSQNIPYKDNVKKMEFTYDNSENYILSDITFVDSLLYEDQVDVFLGGILLKKPNLNRTIHDFNISYDSGEVNSYGQISDIEQESQYSITKVGNDYILTLFPEIINNGKLNYSKITVIQRSGKTWYIENVSLLENSSIQANFLRDQHSYYPDKYKHE